MNDKDNIRQYIIKSFVRDKKTASLTNDTSFFEEGIIDSLGVLQLVAYIEETYGFKVEDEELVPENLDSIDALTSYISSKVGSIETS